MGLRLFSSGRATIEIMKQPGRYLLVPVPKSWHHITVLLWETVDHFCTANRAVPAQSTLLQTAWQGVLLPQRWLYVRLPVRYDRRVLAKCQRDHR